MAIEKAKKGRPKGTEVSRRLNISLPEPLLERLHDLMRETHATSLAELIRSAVLLYAVAFEAHKDSKVLTLVGKDGAQTRLNLFFPEQTGDRT